jgi:hypothetical protein
MATTIQDLNNLNLNSHEQKRKCSSQRTHLPRRRYRNNHNFFSSSHNSDHFLQHLQFVLIPVF